MGKMIELATVIGRYPLFNTGGVLLHAIDHAEDRILATLNGMNPEWCDITEEYREETGEMELGFNLGSIFVPLSGVMRGDI